MTRKERARRVADSFDESFDDDGPGRVRPRGWFLAAAAAGSVGGAVFAGALLLPGIAHWFAAGGVFAGVLIGALLMRRARDRELVEALTPDDESAADRHWELSDIAEHYRRTADDRRRAELASDAKSRFLTTVSHELRTPLSGIIGLTDVLRSTELSAEQESFVAAMRNSGTLMLGLVDDMLDFAKIEAGRFDLAPQPTALEPTLEEIAELFFSRADAKGLDLATYVDPALPARFMVDAPRLRQVLINLLGNAIKYTEEGGATMTVTADPDDSAKLRFAVADTGPGIRPEEAARIFDAFEQLAAEPERRTAGAGLGLGIARRIVNEMDADIALADRPGGGSVFSFALALTPASGAAMPDAAADLAHRSVLIVAPAGPARDLIATHLRDGQMLVQAAADVARAAALAGAAAAAGEGFDLVLVDGRCGTDAKSALATIRDAAGTELPAAILVAPGRRKSPEEMQADGFGAYLVRPIRRRSLMRIVERLISGGDGFRSDPADDPAPVTPRASAGPGRRVLIAEDDDVNALLLRAMLLRYGHEVTTVIDGAAAVEAAKPGAFDLALVDLALPKKDGYDVAAAIRAAERIANAAPMSLIAITADGRPESRERALAGGFDRHILKPLTPDTLRELLDAVAVRAA